MAEDIRAEAERRAEAILDALEIAERPDTLSAISDALVPLLASLAQVTQEVADVLKRTDRYSLDDLANSYINDRDTCIVACNTLAETEQQVSTLSASLAAAQAENDQLTRFINCDECGNKVPKQEPIILCDTCHAKETAAEVAELVALMDEIKRLQGYVQHKVACAYFAGRICSCGLDPAPLPKEPTTP